ncbi:MAG: hypothetical protein ACREF7_01245, partial [Candidatus Saccharimonadales bacterium]
KRPGDDWGIFVKSPLKGDLVELLQPPPNGVGALSEYEVRLVADVWDQYRNLTPYELLALLASLPEFEYREQFSKVIAPETILRSENWSDRDISVWLEEINAIASMDRLLSTTLA